MCARDLDAWQQALDMAEEELRKRERRVLKDLPTPDELRALAAERDKLAAERNGVANAYDEQARERDAAAFGRDVRGSGRDRAARERENDLDLAAIDRLVAGIDRDLAAGDRTDSLEDRQRAADARRAAADDRQRAADERDAAANRDDDMQHEITDLRAALHTRLQIGQAQGLLMSRYHLDPDAAFRLLVRLSQEEHVKLRDVAARIVADAAQQARHDSHERGAPPN